MISPLTSGRHNSRREFLYGLGATLGSVALSALLPTDKAQGASMGPLNPKKGHLPTRAKNCIFLMMSGGPSHIDTFDPKPRPAQRSDPDMLDAAGDRGCRPLDRPVAAVSGPAGPGLVHGRPCPCDRGGKLLEGLGTRDDDRGAVECTPR